MEMPKIKSGKASSENIGDRGGQIIQFRADDLLISQLSVVAERLRTPMGVLARQWVAERVKKELEQEKQAIELWYQKRLPEIDRKLRADMEAGPVQMLHLLPLASDVTIAPERARELQSLLAPVERIDTRYEGHINVHGYVTEKTFKTSTKVNGYVQAFRTGQLESVRILKQDLNFNALYADTVDADLIRVLWSYGTALQQLNVPLPIVLLIRFRDVKGYFLRTRHQASPNTLIDVNEFNLPTVQISDWSQTARLENAAQTLRPALDVFWNAGGFERSFSYKADGAWKGPPVP